MIKIVCNYIDNSLNKLEISGHANAGKNGCDLVCASISAITTSGINCLNKFKKKEIVVKDGYTKIDVLHKLSSEEKIQLDMIVNMLKTMARDYPKNIKFIKEK